MSTALGENSPPHEIHVGPYRLLSRIGEGGMGVVHLGQRPGGDRVAIKVLRPHVVSDDEARARLAREVNSLSLVQSPRVAAIIDADPWGPVPYVATRYVPGLSLHDHVREEGAIVGADLRHFARGLAEALAAVHAVGVLHRDIKPSNVLLEGRNPVLIDFGLARLDDDAQVTRTGYLLGTPGYLAPEVLAGEQPTVAADVYSWAVTVAFAGLGRAPFGSGHALAVMDRVRRGDVDLEGLDADIAGLVRAALAPVPEARPTLGQVFDALVRPGAAAAPVTASVPEPPMTMPFAASPDYLETLHQHEPEPATRVEPPAPATHRLPPEPAPQSAPQSAPQQTWQPPSATAEPYQLPPAPQQPATVTWGERARRWALGIGGVGVLAGAVAAGPVLAAAVICLGVVVLRAGSLSASSAAGRRQSRGAKWYDATLVALTAPWHTLVSLFGSVALLCWTAMLVACALLILVVAGASDDVALAVTGALASVVLWTGPGASRVRSPLRRAGLALTRQPVPWLVIALVLFSSALLLLLIAGVQGPAWAPFSSSPWGDDTWLGRLL